MAKTKNQSGHRTVGIIVAAIVVSVISVAGYLAVRRSSSVENAPTNTSTLPTRQPIADSAAIALQPVPGMKAYSNDKYGISFMYPQEWVVQESSNDAPQGPAPAEYAISLNTNTADKYNTALSLEVYSKEYSAIISYYDTAYSSNPNAHVAKSESTSLGKLSTYYTNTTDTKPTATTRELFLYSVGTKTYSFSSVNEELNIQRDTSYWDKFTKVHDTLQLK